MCAPPPCSLQVPRAAGNSSKSQGYETVGETLKQLTSPREVAQFARLIEASRIAHSHKLNDRSSRSHCLVKMHITIRKQRGKVAKQTFLFVDLAGSERIVKSGVEGQRQMEALVINQSLSTLGRVIKQLNGKQSHISYRDSKLTMLLRSSFGGKSFTQVVVNVANEVAHVDETISSLKFGQSLSSVRNPAAIVSGQDLAELRNSEADLTALFQQMHARLQELKVQGHGGHFGPNATPTDKALYTENINKRKAMQDDLKRLKGMYAEAKAARSQDDRTLENQIAVLKNQEENLRDVILRQESIKGMWVKPTKSYLVLNAELRALKSRIEMSQVNSTGLEG